MPRVSPAVLLRLARPPTLPLASCIARPSRSLASPPSLSIPLLHSGPFSAFRFSTPILSPILGSLMQARFAQRGTEYQPSQRKRKRKHGFLARKRSLGGKKILLRRAAKGRKFLTH